MHQSSSLIQLQDISVTRWVANKARLILDQVSLQVQPHHITTIIGPNGGGKTTLIKILLGLIQPTSGKVIRQPHLNIGYMPQKLSLSPLLPLTVQRFMELASSKTNTKLHHTITQSLMQVGALELAQQQVIHLSGGELQRVLLARALINKPDLLILDEPAQGVDILGQNDLYKLIANLRTEYGCSVLLVSHDLHVVMSASDHVLCLNTHVCCSGHPDLVKKNADYQRLFGLASYTHHHDHLHTTCGHSHD